MVLCVISPAKKLELNKAFPSSIQPTQGLFVAKKNKLAEYLKTLSVNEVKDLLCLSDALSELNWTRFQSLGNMDQRPAIFTYNGDVYSVLDPFSLTSTDLSRLDNQVLILSALYGILRPYDLIEPYRLEMDADVARYTSLAKSLVSFWTDKVTQYLVERARHVPFLLNLASDQYASVIHWKQCPCPVIKPIFLDFKNGCYKPISFSMKKARGAMLRYVIEKNIQDYNGLTLFKDRGYRFQKALSTEERLIFYSGSEN